MEKEEEKTGSIKGVSFAIIADELGITIAQIAKAKKEGCETYEELRAYYKL